MPTCLKKRCCCFTLRTSGKILGWYDVIISIFAIHLLIVLIAYAPQSRLLVFQLTEYSEHALNKKII